MRSRGLELDYRQQHLPLYRFGHVCVPIETVDECSDARENRPSSPKCLFNNNRESTCTAQELFLDSTDQEILQLVADDSLT